MKHKGSVVITRYNEPDQLLLEALESLKLQKGVDLEILMLDQIYSEIIKNYCKDNSSESIAFHYVQIEKKSLSYAKNTGIKMSKNNIVLFLDTDGIASENWASSIIQCIENNPDVAIAGTAVLPKRNGKQFILLKSNMFVNDYSMFNLGKGTFEYHKVLGGSSGLSKKKLKQYANFNENLGRQNGLLLGGEETEMMDVIKKAGFKIFYIGDEYILHQVAPERMTYGRLIKRIFYSGVTKYLRGGMPSPYKYKKTFYDYLFAPIYLVFYGAGLIYASFKFKKFKNNKANG